MLVVRRLIAATPERLFDAWTRPQELRRWWGPESVSCTAAEVDLRVGGCYRIANQFSDGTTLWIIGEFELIERPRKLVYTWRIGGGSQASERVTVAFEPRDRGTEIVVTHERVVDASTRERHEQGWTGCLAGLENYLTRGAQTHPAGPRV
jgi:uncharacterized protein YndB with AHSA1/START domain